MKNQDNPSQETLEKWSKDPDNWIWGIFYYNKEDKRILPPKKNASIGNTINFANRKSILFMIGALLFFAFVIFSILKNK
ncbi:hypothetical protein [Flavobacterium sp. AED]|uniref:hypothetical protein n=1 Tax=Flavobacterium sp. AED TaxID=1423323 RepID=UPI00057DC376|nr:hypothetical protein [Flavobacterium sp. AED]KIA85228.1 hypothetical protein OA85_12580 [Flavobacterium sp. AED]